MFHNDIVYDTPSDFGIGETLYGKKAVADWFRRWKEEFPKRKLDVKNICFSSWPLNFFNNSCAVQWTLTKTNKQGKTFRYDGASFVYIRKLKTIHATEYISFKGLPKLSELIEPLAKD
jgi:hypothetical protein